MTVDSASRYFGLNVAHQTSMTEASVLKGNAMDLEVGHPILDPALAIEGGPAAAVRNVLLDPRVLPALLELADRKSLRITTRDGLVRVYHGAGDRNEAVVQLALGLAAASQEHASTASAADGDAEWQRFRSLEERRAENQELTKAWGSQGIALLLAVMVAFKATHVFNGKMNLGPIEILALVLGGIGLPHYTAAVVGMIGVAWFGFAIPATVHFAKLVRSATFPRKSPAWSFVFAPFLLICAIVTYQAEAAEPVAAATVPTPSHAASVKAVTPAQGKPKPVSKPSPGTVHDTEKRAFHVSCPKGSTALDACDVKGATPDVRPQSKPKPYGGDPAFFLTRSAIISVCDGNRNGGSTPWGPSGCRPIACSTSDDCPHSDRETGATVCSQGLCQATMGKLSATDVESLCMAGVGPALDGPEVDPRVALAKSACGGSTCAIAAGVSAAVARPTATRSPSGRPPPSSESCCRCR